MGYTTYFDGHVTLDPPLTPEQRDYINKFSNSRRMDRENGPYFVDGEGYCGQDHGPDEVYDHNVPHPSQPGLWCQWVVSDDGSTLEWDGGEKFYCATEWMEYLIQHFLGSNPEANGSEYVPDFGTGRVCNGFITAQGEDSMDLWAIEVKDNIVRELEGRVEYF